MNGTTVTRSSNLIAVTAYLLPKVAGLYLASMLDGVPAMNPKAHVRSLTPDTLARKFWPSAMIALGLGLSAAWLCLLGYGVVKMMELAIR